MSGDREDGEARGPLTGMFDNIGDVTLEQAFGPVKDKHRKSLLNTCRVKAKKLAKKTGLSEPQIGALVGYSAELQPPSDSPYWECNGALRSQDRTEVAPWRFFIWLLLSGLSRLPPAPFDSLWRGYKKSVQDLGENFESGATLIFSGFTSAASSIEVMQTFVGTKGPRTLLNLKLIRRGRSLKDFSFFPAEAEVVLAPNATFEVTGHFDAGAGLTIVTAQEVECVHELLEMAP